MKHGIAKATPVIRWQVVCAEHGEVGLASTVREVADEAADAHNRMFHASNPNRTKEESTR